MTCKDNTLFLERSSGTGLSSMAKCVRWEHSHTVTDTLESSLSLLHPLLDHWPMLRISLPELQRMQTNGLLCIIMQLTFLYPKTPKTHILWRSLNLLSIFPKVLCTTINNLMNMQQCRTNLNLLWMFNYYCNSFCQINVLVSITEIASTL